MSRVYTLPPIYLTAVLILSSRTSLDFPSCLFLSGCLTETLHAFLTASVRATWPSIFTLFDFITRIIFDIGHGDGPFVFIRHSKIHSIMFIQLVRLLLQLYCYVVRHWGRYICRSIWKQNSLSTWRCTSVLNLCFYLFQVRNIELLRLNWYCATKNLNWWVEFYILKQFISVFVYCHIFGLFVSLYARVLDKALLSAYRTSD